MGGTIAARFNADGLWLDGSFTPSSAAGPRPAVLCVHGYTGRKETYMPPFLRELTAAGFHTLDFHHRGFGASEGPRLRVDPHAQIRDILAARIWLAARPEVDAARIGLLGLSHGGGTSIAAAAADPGIAAVATVGAPGDGARWMRSKRTDAEWAALQDELAADRIARVTTGESRRLPYQELAPPGPAERAAFATMYRTEDAYPEGYPLENIDLACAFRAADHVARIAPRPLLLVHAGADTMVRPLEAEALYAAAGEPKELLVLPGINHADVYEPRDAKSFAAVMERLRAFFLAHLGDG